MTQGSHQGAHDSLDEARRQLERWRRTRKRGTRIPAPLWAAAVEAAREHGVSRAASALRLDYYGLKERLESPPLESPPLESLPLESAPEPSGHEAANGGGFLEIPLFASAAPECVFELEDGHGSRLRVAVKGAALAEMEALARALWSMAR